MVLGKITRGHSALFGGLAVAVIVGAGVVVFTHSHANTQVRASVAASTSTVSSVQAQPVETAVLVAQQSPVANQNVEKIPELGLAVTVPDSIQDLTYQVSKITLKNGNVATLAMFSTASLTQADPACSASAGPLGSLGRANGQYPSDDPYAELDYGRLVKQFPTFYIAAGFPQGACSTDASKSAIAAAHKGDFAAAGASIQQAN